LSYARFPCSEQQVWHWLKGFANGLTWRFRFPVKTGRLY